MSKSKEIKTLLIAVFLVFIYFIISIFLWSIHCDYIKFAAVSGGFLICNCLIFVSVILKRTYQNISQLFIFYLSFIFFSAGHLFVIFFGAEKDILMYIWRFDRITDRTYNETIMFTTYSILLFQIGYILSLHGNGTKIKKAHKIIRSPIDVDIFVNIGFYIAFSALMFVSFLYRSMASNYADIYQQTYGWYYNLVVGLSLFLIPLYLLIQYGQSNIRKYTATVCMIISIAVTLVVGRRGNALMFLLPIALVIAHKIDFTKRRIFIFICSAVSLYFAANLLYTISLTRVEPVDFIGFVQLYFSNFIEFQSIKYLVIEMGSSIRNLMEIITLMDDKADTYKHGLTYLYSLIIILPGGLRGNLDQMAVDDHLMNLASYITEASGASYGLGGSIQMEAYFNFSMAGVLVFVLLGYIIGHALDGRHFINEKFDYYYKICLLSFLIMLPRTCMQDNLKRIVYCCIIPFYLYSRLTGNEKER